VTQEHPTKFLAYCHKLNVAKYSPKKLYTYWSLKLDGYCLYVHKRATGAVVAFTRNGEDYTEYFRALPEYGLAMANLPPGAMIVGEIHTNTTSAGVITALKEGSKDLEFCAFGVPSMQYSATMTAAETYCTSKGFKFIQWGLTEHGLASPMLAPFRTSDLASVRRVNALPYELDALPTGIEGYVYRTGQLAGLAKQKPFDTIDLIVKAVEEGKDDFAGIVGALVLQTTEGHTVCRVSSGLKVEERSVYMLDMSKIVGKVVEIAYDSVSKASLRFPRLVRIREDKAPEDCSVNQSPELAKALANVPTT
jgi:hypothetical protein